MADILDGGVNLVAVTKARLEAQLGDAVKTYGEAADLARLVGAKALPAAHTAPALYVIEPDDTAEQNAVASGLAVSQRVTVRLAAILALYRPNDPTGAKALEQLETLKQPLMAALIGWEPGGDFEPLEHERRGLLSAVGAPLVVYRQFVRTRWHIRKH